MRYIYSYIEIAKQYHVMHNELKFSILLIVKGRTSKQLSLVYTKI